MRIDPKTARRLYRTELEARLPRGGSMRSYAADGRLPPTPPFGSHGPSEPPPGSG